MSLPTCVVPDEPHRSEMMVMLRCRCWSELILKFPDPGWLPGEEPQFLWAVQIKDLFRITRTRRLAQKTSQIMDQGCSRAWLLCPLSWHLPLPTHLWPLHCPRAPFCSHCPVPSSPPMTRKAHRGFTVDTSKQTAGVEQAELAREAQGCRSQARGNSGLSVSHQRL